MKTYPLPAKVPARLFFCGLLFVMLGFYGCSHQPTAEEETRVTSSAPLSDRTFLTDSWSWPVIEEDEIVFVDEAEQAPLYPVRSTASTTSMDSRTDSTLTQNEFSDVDRNIASVPGEARATEPTTRTSWGVLALIVLIIVTLGVAFRSMRNAHRMRT